MTIDILGTKYKVEFKKYNEDEVFERRGIGGYCDNYAKRIVVCKMSTYKGWEYEAEDTKEKCEKLTLRHEIVHAVFNESGVADNSNWEDGTWARNEEMVDWIAAQGSKIYKAWQDAKAI